MDDQRAAAAADRPVWPFLMNIVIYIQSISITVQSLV